MTYLFDTHTYLWFRGAPGLLPSKVMDILTDTSQRGFLSVVTPWEIAIKTGAGKLNGVTLLVNWESRETAAGFSIADITIEQAITSGVLPRHHRDPFDRLLIAQSLEMGIPIISNDRTFDLYGVQRIWD